MKTQLMLAVTVLLCAMFGVELATVFAGGELTPPGPPGPTMKSLDEVEPRRPIFDPGHLDQPGSYYLVHDITVPGGTAITIAADGVALDLNGFTIRSEAATPNGRGVFLEGVRRNITIVNGFIEGGVTLSGGSYVGTGFGAGIYSDDTTAAHNVVVRDVSVSGCLNNGIHLGTSSVGGSSVVESCTVRTVGHYGIYASTITGCVATECGNNAIYGEQVSDCRGESSIGAGVYARTAHNCFGLSDSGSGIQTLAAALNCYGQSYHGDGVSAGLNAQNCHGISTSGDGLTAKTAQTCYGESTSGDGLVATAAQSCYGNASGSGTGLDVDLAIGCYGYSSSGTGLIAVNANSCDAGTFDGTYLYVIHKYNMP